MEQIKKNPDKEWDWWRVSDNPNVTWDIISQNLDKLWDWRWISENPNITWDIISENLDKPWDWEGVSENKMTAYYEQIFDRVITEMIKDEMKGVRKELFDELVATMLDYDNRELAIKVGALE